MLVTETFKSLAYTLVTVTVDSFYALGSLLGWIPTKRRVSDYERSSDIDSLADGQILELYSTMPELIKTSDPWAGHNLARLSEGTVGKLSQDFEEDVDEASEALTLDMIFRHTIIPVPRVRRVVKGKYTNIIAMDFIPGRPLSELWPSMSYLSRIRIAITLRQYILQMRAIRHPRSAIPGPLSTNEPRVCVSPIFGQVVSRRGPFASYGELSAFFNDRLRLASTSRFFKPSSVTTKFDDSSPLVLTHQDINMRNLIVGDDGQLWVVDWAWAGFYPCWFEFVGMKRQADNEETLTGRKEPMWDALIPFICGPSFKQERWLNRMSIALDWA